MIRRVAGTGRCDFGLLRDDQGITPYFVVPLVASRMASVNRAAGGGLRRVGARKDGRHGRRVAAAPGWRCRGDELGRGSTDAAYPAGSPTATKPARPSPTILLPGSTQ